MRLPFFICATFLIGCSPHSKSVASQLSKYQAGDETDLFIAELHLSSTPSRATPNLPMNEDHTIYYLPEGNLHVISHLSSTGKAILTDTPFLIEDSTSVEKRLMGADASWDDYVRQKAKQTEQGAAANP